MAVKYQDYYAILGVGRAASLGEIKKIYRRLVRRHHPDVNPGDKVAEEKFKDIQEAYAVLSDSDKRKRYDRLGPNWRAGAAFTPPDPRRDFRVEFSQGGDLGNLFTDSGQSSDFFRAIFGGAGGARPASKTYSAFSPPGRDVEAEIELSLDQAHQGARSSIALQSFDQSRLTVKIPPGTRDGSVLRLAGKGQVGAGISTPGDLYLRIRIAHHPIFSVIGGDDVQIELLLAPWEAVLGTKVRVPTLDSPVEMSIPSGTQGGGRLRLRGQGLKRKDGARGDQYVRIRIVIPPRLTQEEKALFEKLADTSHFNPRDLSAGDVP